MAPQAWMSLADVQEKLQDWDGAYATWDSLCKLAQESGVRELAQASLPRVNDERVIGRLVQAEQMASTEDYMIALTSLLDAASLKPSARTFDRVRNRYFEVLGLWFAKEISSAKTSSGWRSLAVANFVGGSQMEGLSIRDRICSSFATGGTGSPKILFLSETGIGALKRGEPRQVPDRDRKEIEQTGADAVVFGTLGAQLQSYLFDVRAQQTHPLLTVQPLSSVPGFPSNVEAWMRLPSKNTTGRGLRVEVWTDRAGYAIDAEVVFHLRSNRDCYVTLLDLQTSGGLYVLFPNSLQRDNHVRANRIYSIPESQAPFSITASGPTGVEGVKAIATNKPFETGELAAGQSFIVARTPESQGRLCQGIRSVLDSLDTNEWDIAECTLEIGE